MRANAAICRLSLAALTEILEIEAESNSPAWSYAAFTDEFTNKCAVIYGARHAGELVGFLACRMVVDEAHIMRVGVRVAERGKGIGRALVQYVLADLFENAVRWVSLEVRKSNEIARALYESLGFNVVDERSRYYADNGEDGLIMSLNLDSFAADRRLLT